MSHIASWIKVEAFCAVIQLSSPQAHGLCPIALNEPSSWPLHFSLPFIWQLLILKASTEITLSREPFLHYPPLKDCPWPIQSTIPPRIFPSSLQTFSWSYLVYSFIFWLPFCYLLSFTRLQTPWGRGLCFSYSQLCSQHVTKCLP